MKYEDVYLHAYDNGKALWTGLLKYFEFYNAQGVHQSLNHGTMFTAVARNSDVQHDRGRKAAELLTLRVRAQMLERSMNSKATEIIKHRARRST